MTDSELRELLARTSPGTAKTDWKHGLVPSTVAGICAELLELRALTEPVQGKLRSGAKWSELSQDEKRRFLREALK